MNKKKAIVCTTLFAVVLIGVIASTMLVRNEHGFNLYSVVTGCISAYWLCERIEKFYSWLIEKEN